MNQSDQDKQNNLAAAHPAVQWDNLDPSTLMRMAADRSGPGRRQLVSLIGELFNTRGDALSARERTLMAEILIRLVREFEMAVRYELSVRLAANPLVPHELIVLLANDEIEVARPVLLDSVVLDDGDLIRILKEKTQQHQLAVALRRSLSPEVCDEIVRTRHVEVIAAMLANEGAQLNYLTMRELVAEAQDQEVYREPLVTRRELTHDLAARLYAVVGRSLRDTLAARFPAVAGMLEPVVNQAVDALTAADGAKRAPEQTSKRADELARKLADGGLITPELLVRVLRQGEIQLFKALFSSLTGLKEHQVHLLLFEPTRKNLAIACRAIDLDRSHAASILLLAFQHRNYKGATPAEIRAVMATFEGLRVDEADHILEAWRANPELLETLPEH